MKKTEQLHMDSESAATAEKAQAMYDCANLRAFSGYYVDEKLLKQSASGGAAAAITDTVLALGGVVFGVVYSADFKSAHYACAYTAEEAVGFKGSKYIFAEPFLYADGQKKSVYLAVAETLQAGKTVLFTGTGCCVGALKQYLEKQQVDDTKLITVDLFCHGAALPEIQKQMVERLEEKFRSKLREFSVRYKKTGWVPRYLHAVFENGKVYDKPLFETDFGYAFKVYSRDACFSCRFKGDSHIADITLGDYWGLSKQAEDYNPYGVSVMLSRSGKGLALIDSIDPNVFSLTEIAPEKAADGNPMFYKCRVKPADAAAFKKNLQTKGLGYAVRHCVGYRKFQIGKMKAKMKRALPESVLDRIRKR